MDFQEHVHTQQKCPNHAKPRFARANWPVPVLPSSHERGRFMALEARSHNLLDDLVRRSRLSQFWATAAVSAFLLSLLVLAAYLDGAFSEGFEWPIWRPHLEAPVIIIYTLILHPFLWKLHLKAVEAFRPLSRLDDREFDKVAEEVLTLDRRREWVAIIMGLAFIFVLSQPWGWEHSGGWLRVYTIVTAPLMWGLLGWLVYVLVEGTLRLRRLSSNDLDVNIFNSGQLAPVARRSLGLSLVIMGGTTIAVLFAPRDGLLSWQSITAYSLMVCVMLLTFFLSMWSVHRAMARVKYRELAMVQERMSAAYHELKHKEVGNEPEGTEALSANLAAWVTCEGWIKQAPEWPFAAGVIRRLAASTLIPGAAYLLKALLGSQGLRLGP